MNATTLGALQSSMQELFPFARIRCTEHVLDGELEAEIVMPNAEQEWAQARKFVNAGVFAKALQLMSLGFFASGAFFYVRDHVLSLA